MTRTPFVCAPQSIPQIAVKFLVFFKNIFINKKLCCFFFSTQWPTSSSGKWPPSWRKRRPSFVARWVKQSRLPFRFSSPTFIHTVVFYHLFRLDSITEPVTRFPSFWTVSRMLSRIAPIIWPWKWKLFSFFFASPWVHDDGKKNEW